MPNYVCAYLYCTYKYCDLATFAVSAYVSLNTPGDTVFLWVNRVK